MQIEGVNMKKVMISPSRYVQGAGAIQDLGGYVKGLGAKPLVIGAGMVWAACVRKSRPDLLRRG